MDDVQMNETSTEGGVHCGQQRLFPLLNSKD